MVKSGTLRQGGGAVRRPQHVLHGGHPAVQHHQLDGPAELTLLLSFARFEREGLWMGGTVPLGYAARDRRLVVEPAEAETVRRIFRRYRELGRVRRLKEELNREGVRPRPWRGAQAAGFSRGALYALLGNPVYIGETRHKGQCRPGQHEPVIDRALWEEVRRLMRGNAPIAPDGRGAPRPARSRAGCSTNRTAG